MTKYYLELHPGGKVAKIERCATEIALGLKAYSNPIIKVIPEQGLVVVEVLSSRPKKILFSDLKITLSDNLKTMTLPIILGQAHDGQNLVVDLSEMPHLLIAGTTGSGKSVMLHSIINSLINNDNVKLVMIDPKKVELSYYSGIENLMYPVITDYDQAIDVLSDLVEEMENRFSIMNRRSANSLGDLNNKLRKKIPHIVLVIDEFSDLSLIPKKIFQKKICALAQKSRACGIHIVIATQRPSVDVITGLIKANFPARISCSLPSVVDSRTILGGSGAEKLLGKGDAIINSAQHNMIRFQGAYISTDEIELNVATVQRSKINKFINFIRGIR